MTKFSKSRGSATLYVLLVLFGIIAVAGSGVLTLSQIRKSNQVESGLFDQRALVGTLKLVFSASSACANHLAHPTSQIISEVKAMMANPQYSGREDLQIHYPGTLKPVLGRGVRYSSLVIDKVKVVRTIPISSGPNGTSQLASIKVTFSNEIPVRPIEIPIYFSFNAAGTATACRITRYSDPVVSAAYPTAGPKATATSEDVLCQTLQQNNPIYAFDPSGGFGGSGRCVPL